MYSNFKLQLALHSAIFQGAPRGTRKVPVIVAMVGMALFTLPAALVIRNVVAFDCIPIHD